MFAVTQHKKFFTLSPLRAGCAFLTALAVMSAPSLAQADTEACLIRTTDTSRWSPASPDPTGITVLPNGHLLVSDSEVEECVNGNPPAYWEGANLFEVTRSGTLVATSTTYTPLANSCTPRFGTGANFSKEPTGVAINPSNGHLFVADDAAGPYRRKLDDDQKKVFEVDPGLDGRYGTADDIVTSFDTTAFGSFAPEGIVVGQDNLFVADRIGLEVYQLAPGVNGIFDGVPPAGDDVVVTHFNTASLGILDLQGIAFNSDSDTLYLIGGNQQLVETTTAGTLVQQIDISSVNACLPGDVAWAASSLSARVKHLYITERGVDNDTDRFANDGKVYEVSLDPAECGSLSQNLLFNPGFERDCTNISFPDKWTIDSRFTRSAEVTHGGDFAGKHFATDDSSYTIQQIANNLNNPKPGAETPNGHLRVQPGGAMARYWYQRHYQHPTLQDLHNRDRRLGPCSGQPGGACGDDACPGGDGRQQLERDGLRR